MRFLKRVEKIKLGNDARLLSKMFRLKENMPEKRSM